jgi:membrane protein DedA with SNARE-associated domain
VLDAIDAYVLPVLEHAYATFGYLGVVLAMTVESAALPVPSELILPLAGFSVARGVAEPLTGAAWTYWGAVTAGVIGNTTGSLIGYAIGAYGGRPLLARYGRYVLVSSHDIELAEGHFARWGDITVLVSRMVPIVRTFISIPAGIARMPLWRFVTFSVVGAIPWVMLLVWGGVVLGDHWVDIKRSFAGLDYVIAAVILAGVALFVWRHVRVR